MQRHHRPVLVLNVLGRVFWFQLFEMLCHETPFLPQVTAVARGQILHLFWRRRNNFSSQFSCKCRVLTHLAGFLTHYRLQRQLCAEDASRDHNWCHFV